VSGATALDGTIGDRADEIVPGDIPGGPSTSQTIMVSSLQQLLSVVPEDAPAAAYRAAVMIDNVLGKQTSGSREWSFRQLRRFYGLDPQLVLFRALRDLWQDDVVGQPLLALLCAMARDPVLRTSATVIQSAKLNAPVGAPDFNDHIEVAFPGVYKDSTRKTAAANLASSWQQAGFLRAENTKRKVRAHATATPAAVTFALMLGHLQHERGQALFETIWARTLDQPTTRLIDLAVAASQRGLLEFRHAGGVIDVTFHRLLRSFAGDQGALL
jgi:hypothetical protein